MRAIALIALACAALVSPLSAQTTNQPNSAPLGGFGVASVYVDGLLYVTRPGELGLFPMPANRTGAIHVFERSGDGWVEIATVAPESADLGIGFGDALAVHGTTMVVGAPRDGDAGAAYVFERGDDGEWTEVARLTPEAGEAGEGFGTATGVSGDLALVASPNRGTGGSVTAFRRSRDGWNRVAELTPPTESDGVRFGASLALDGTTAVVGAPGDMVGLLPGGPPPNLIPGAAYVYRAEDGGENWVQEARLESGLPGPGGLGFAVLLRNGEVFATAPFANQFGGAVFHFAATGNAGEWGQAAMITATQAPPQSLIGFSVAFAGADLVVGGPLIGGATGGAVVFRQAEDGSWTDVQQLTSTNAFAFFGFSVAAGPGLAVVGAPGEAFFEGTGHSYAQNESTGEWAEEVELFDEAAGMDAVVGGQVDCAEGEARSFTCEEVDLVAFLPVRSLGGGRGIIVNDLWGWTDTETGREYAIVGRNNGTTFVDITDAANPVYLGELPLTEGAAVNMWRDVKVLNDHALIVADNAGPHGIQIFDLRQLRDLENTPVTFEETAHYDGIFSAHNIVVNEATSFAYVVGASGGGQTCGGGLHMVDLTDPVNPTFAGCFSDANTGHASSGYSHDAQCIRYEGPDPDHAGREICFGANENALSIADVTDKENPVALAAMEYPNSAYLHQGWVSDDHRYFYMNDELDELAGAAPRTRTLVWDIEDLDDPVLVNEHLGTNEASDHNLYVQGDLMYQSNYLSGLRILDISDPENPEEVGFFDTVPQGGDIPGFAGSWSNYPFFESGVIIVTSMREGLFVLKKKTTPVT